MGRVVGIDLGTTNSLVAYMDKGTPKVIGGDHGGLVPSVVSFLDGQIAVGFPAKMRLITHADRTIYSIKRFMGKGIEDISKEDRAFIPFELLEGQRGVIRIRVGEKRYTPSEISAFILMELKARAKAHLKEEISQAVITVPAYFNDAQRQATKDAGKIAGLEVLRIVNEPTAASLAYGLQKRKEGIIAVYDLGGGTFDVSILKIKNGIFEVLSTNGDTHLGGDDIDQRLSAVLLEEIEKKTGCRLEENPEALQNLRLILERAKCELSFQERVGFEIPLGNARSYHREMTREEFEGLIREIVDRTVGPCKQALADAGLSSDRVNEAVLVGGSTRIPLVRRTVERLFDKRPHSELDPDEVVALGAAVQADILSGGISDMLLLDVTPLSLGIETLGGVVSKLIHRNSTIPTSAKEQFTTAVDGQRSVMIHVLQGERELAKDCRSLARFNLTDIDPMPAGIPKIEVTFLIDANGILSVTAKELRTEKVQSIEVKPSYGLTEGEVEKMIDDSFRHAKADMEERLLIEAKTEAEGIIHHAEKVVVQGANLIAPDELDEIKKNLEVLKEKVKGGDRHAIREGVERLDRSAQGLTQALMNQAVRSALKEKKLSDL
jgi:Fe-S protein assembly chaperone HscA